MTVTVEDLKAVPKARHSSTLPEAKRRRASGSSPPVLALHGCALGVDAVDHTSDPVSCLSMPYGIHLLLTDNGTSVRRVAAQLIYRFVPSDARRHDLQGRTASSTRLPNHTIRNQRALQMNRTIQDPPVRRTHHETYDQLRVHFVGFMSADNFASRLKTLSDHTPHEIIAEI